MDTTDYFFDVLTSDEFFEVLKRARSSNRNSHRRTYSDIVSMLCEMALDDFKDFHESGKTLEEWKSDG
jgi:hypothetical protein